MNTSHNGTPTVRCAIYTRKSTDEGLERAFNTLDAQRDSAEAYIKSQAQSAWTCLRKRYDDGGYSGGSMDRPALKSLLADIEAGQIDCVLVYKVDRLSRSLLDFARMMELFEKQQVSFVAVTQQLNTATSMGRLILNVLLSFAQFEREIVSERTRDKIAAARRKGKWSGGWPLLGYDLDPQRTRLVVNDKEARRVRAIFALYRQKKGLLPVIKELERRGWLSKRWLTRRGHIHGGRPFTKTSLYNLLTNPAYIGKVRHNGEQYDGEHLPIVDLAPWQHVQNLLKRAGRRTQASARSSSDALLKGLVRCVPCGRAMISARTSKHRPKQYQYYTCTGAQKRGWHSCPSKSISAPHLERLVIAQLQCLDQDPRLSAEALALKLLEKPTSASDRPIENGHLEPDRQEQQLLVKRLLQRVDYDGASHKVSLVFLPSAIRTLAHEANGHNGENKP